MAHIAHDVAVILCHCCPLRQVDGTARGCGRRQAAGVVAEDTVFGRQRTALHIDGRTSGCRTVGNRGVLDFGRCAIGHNHAGTVLAVVGVDRRGRIAPTQLEAVHDAARHPVEGHQMGHVARVVAIGHLARDDGRIGHWIAQRCVSSGQFGGIATIDAHTRHHRNRRAAQTALCRAAGRIERTLLDVDCTRQTTLPEVGQGVGQVVERTVPADARRAVGASARTVGIDEHHSQAADGCVRRGFSLRSVCAQRTLRAEVVAQQVVGDVACRDVGRSRLVDVEQLQTRVAEARRRCRHPQTAVQVAVDRIERDACLVAHVAAGVERIGEHRKFFERRCAAAVLVLVRQLADADLLRARPVSVVGARDGHIGHNRLQVVARRRTCGCILQVVGVVGRCLVAPQHAVVDSGMVAHVDAAAPSGHDAVERHAGAVGLVVDDGQTVDQAALVHVDAASLDGRCVLRNEAGRCRQRILSIACRVGRCVVVETQATAAAAHVVDDGAMGHKARLLDCDAAAEARCRVDAERLAVVHVAVFDQAAAVEVEAAAASRSLAVIDLAITHNGVAHQVGTAAECIVIDIVDVAVVGIAVADHHAVEHCRVGQRGVVLRAAGIGRKAVVGEPHYVIAVAEVGCVVTVLRVVPREDGIARQRTGELCAVLHVGSDFGRDGLALGDDFLGRRTRLVAGETAIHRDAGRNLD